jgi:hypothetical protein
LRPCRRDLKESPAEPAAWASERRIDSVATATERGELTATYVVPFGELSTLSLEPEDVISPELCLVDPELASRARALLPSYEDETHDHDAPHAESFDAFSDLPRDEVRVISPELALVDPELAAWARAQLPEEPPYFELPASPNDEPETRESVEVPESVESDSPLPILWGFIADADADRRAAERRRGRRLRRGAARFAGTAAAAVILLGAGLLAAYAIRGTPRSAPAAANIMMSTDAAQPAAFDSVRKASLASGGAPPSAPHLVARAPARRFVWTRVAGAAAYDVRLYRQSRAVFETRTTHPWIRFPARATSRGRRVVLGPGVYTCYVRPIFRFRKGVRLGPAIVNVNLTLAGARSSGTR